MTSGDTEVLIHALCQWGQDALDKLEGMWAFAWYNKQNGTLLLSRDRFGEKPLYIWPRDGGLYFASEVKGLVSMTGVWPRVNEKHLLRYMVNGYKALYKTRETFFQEVEELPASTNLQVDTTGKRSSRIYWTPKLVEDEGLSYADAVAMTREAVINAVRLRMRSDVPLAFCMSGGVDSNSLIAVASRVLGCDVHGFTIVNTDARYEEQTLVDQAVKELDIRHTPVPLSTENFLPNMRRLISAHDAPVYTISYYVHWLLMDQVREYGYKISISGTGADELFSGYYDHHLLYLASIYGDNKLYKKSRGNWHKHVAPIVRNQYLQDPERFINDPGFRDHIYSGKDFTDRLHKSFFEPFQEKEYPVSLLRKRMLNELFSESVPVILHEDDLNAMFFSMENRSPFLDRSLFDVAYSIPDRHLIKDARTKSVLRDAMMDIVPDLILNERRKVGFNAPIMDLLDVHDAEIKEFMLDNSPVYDIVSKNWIEKIMQQDNLSNSESKFLFSFVSMKIFLDEFNN
jgi:asparagine synthase (glutamine-hydrolysing)